MLYAPVYTNTVRISLAFCQYYLYSTASSLPTSTTVYCVHMSAEGAGEIKVFSTNCTARNCNVRRKGKSEGERAANPAAGWKTPC